MNFREWWRRPWKWVWSMITWQRSGWTPTHVTPMRPGWWVWEGSRISPTGISWSRSPTGQTSILMTWLRFWSVSWYSSDKTKKAIKTSPTSRTCGGKDKDENHDDTYTVSQVFPLQIHSNSHLWRGYKETNIGWSSNYCKEDGNLERIKLTINKIWRNICLNYRSYEWIISITIMYTKVDNYS